MIEVGVGFDPASINLGVSVIRLSNAEAIAGWTRTLHATGDVPKRLTKLRSQILDFLAAVEREGMTIRFFGMENPAMGNIKRRDKNGKLVQNRHDTAFTLGRAFEMTWRACESYSLAIQRPISVYEVRPADSSLAVSVRASASKVDRNIATCRLSGGYFNAEQSVCVGGSLDQAEPDGLDANAAAIAGWGLWKQQFVIAANSNSATTKGNGKKATRRRVA